ncbi:MAG: rod shape-determining protein MreC [Pseudomonadota bacterium]
MLFSAVKPQAVEQLRIGVTDFVSPVLITVSRPFFATADFVSGVSGISELRAENARLEAENIRLRDWYQKALMLQSENQSLQELLNLRSNQESSFVTTRVIADSGNAYVHSVLVAEGARAGIEKGQAVLSGEGMIGRIIEVGKNSSRVLLITDFNSRIPVLIEGSRQKAVMTGNNDPLPLLKYLPPDGEIEEGMRIVTSGHGGLFAPGLSIGRIVKNAEGQYAVKPFADMRRVGYVRVIDAPNDPNLRRGVLDIEMNP